MNSDLVACIGILIFISAILLMAVVSDYEYWYYMKEMREEEEFFLNENRL